MRGIEWSVHALEDFRGAIAFIARKSETSARAVAERVLGAINNLADHPTGRPGRVTGTYEKPVARTPYIVAYALTERKIYILRVVHGARDWPDEEWPDA